MLQHKLPWHFLVFSDILGLSVALVLCNFKKDLIPGGIFNN